MSLSINLKRPICFFDLETTGINIVNDRIVEISIIKINIDNSEESKTWLINPTIPIPPMTSAIHGITDEMVKDKPVTEKELISFCKETLAGFKVPKKVEFCDLPKTSTGKIQKFELRKKAKELN